MSAWADRHRILSAGAAAGPWRTADVAYTREWMDALLSPWCRQVTVVGSTQIGKTEAAHNVVGYFATEDPTACMVVMPRAFDVRYCSRMRLRPMLLASPAMRREITGNRVDFGTKDIVLARGSIMVRQATSPADLASAPVQVVVCDELDKWPMFSAREANPLELVRERQRTYRHLARTFVLSTPGPGNSAIWREWKDGDQRTFHVPCPTCGRWLPLQWSQVRWPDAITTANDMQRERAAWYECEACHGRIDDAQKAVAVSRGEWVPAGQSIEQWRRGRADDRTAHRSYRLWAGYSPWLAWWQIVAQWLHSRGVPDREQNWTNSWLGEPWDDRVGDTTKDDLAKCVRPWPQGTVPPDAALLTMAVDVQDTWLAWQVQSWSPGSTSAVVAAGTATTFWEVEKQLARKWGAAGLRVRLCLIDGRARVGEVVDFARQRADVVRVIKGVRRANPLHLWGTIRIDRHPVTGAALPDAVVAWTVNVGPFRDRAWTAVQRSADSKATAGRLLLPNDLPDTWRDQMTAEHKVRKVHKDGTVAVLWQKKPGARRNEAFDLTTYNYAAAAMLQVHKLRTGRRQPEESEDDDQVEQAAGD